MTDKVEAVFLVTEKEKNDLEWYLKTLRETEEIRHFGLEHYLKKGGANK